MPTVGIHVPRWFRKDDTSNEMFYDDLIHTLQESGVCRVMSLNLENLHLCSDEDAKSFCERHTLALIIEHDSYFFSKHSQYQQNRLLLEPHVRFLNSLQSHEIGHHKMRTKEALKNKDVPLLTGNIARSLNEFIECTPGGDWRVIKPLNSGAGEGVKLIRRSGTSVYEFHNGRWKRAQIRESHSGTVIVNRTNGSRLVLPSLGIGVAAIFALVFVSKEAALFLFWFLALATTVWMLVRDKGYRYHDVLIEPYFNDDLQGFSSLRCTVVDDRVVEAVKRTNRKNITSNISKGGSATPVQLTDHQIKIAIAAKNAIGATYAGVDLLVCGQETVVGEINIGPFTLYQRYTGVHLGRILGLTVLSMLSNAPPPSVLDEFRDCSRYNL